MLNEKRSSEARIATVIAGSVEGRSTDAVVKAVKHLVQSEKVQPGTPLPSVRALAAALDMSPTSVHKAWLALQAEGFLRTEGRRGTYVASPAVERSSDVWRRQVSAGLPFDLSTGAPDANLLPAMRLEAIDSVVRQSSYYGPIVVPELGAAIRDSWGIRFAPEALTVVDGSLDALDRLIGLLVRHGDRVMIETPTYPPIISLLELAGAILLPIELDESGPRPEQVELALKREPRLFLFQPRAQNPTGVAITGERRDQLVSLLRGRDCLVIEHDSAGDISTSPLISCTDSLPETTVRIHGYSKSFGPDLRLAAVAGPGAIIDRLVTRRHLGPAWSSRLLQYMLAALLSDVDTRAKVAEAAVVYRGRREALSSALAACGVSTIGSDGYNIWVPLEQNIDAIVALAQRGFGVANGAAFQVGSQARFCRITAATLQKEHAEIIAAAIAMRPDGTAAQQINN
ncbi:PLP-dependent aminotransferase family protein [Microbacterium sp. 18062]|uniref:aminotransferase-like domain-containing protein n=1 Tax=Microbacterium sp. 18062 TaxID=2681410 RepID=UPI0013579334|nr:aminotransferase class I/II-fold pyridoxal phosphate-dependent enzyme [Microbacterium sp. 18062]